MATPLEMEVYFCQDCKLLSGLPSDQEFEYWTIKNGMTIGFPGEAPIPCHSEIVPCQEHLAKLEAAFPE